MCFSSSVLMASKCRCSGAHATNHLQVLGTFLSHQLATQELGTSSDFAQQVLTYLLSHDYYALLAQAIGTIVRYSSFVYTTACSRFYIVVTGRADIVAHPSQTCRTYNSPIPGFFTIISIIPPSRLFAPQVYLHHPSSPKSTTYPITYTTICQSTSE